ncbi:MAG: discoidin domain-containing protein [Bacteroidota bacterium]|nr:discoidin domain-containing protein [Bacteroidota bacterium]
MNSYQGTMISGKLPRTKSHFESWILIIVYRLLFFSTSTSLPAQTKLLDNFESLNGWTPIVSDGVTMSIESAPGKIGKAMAIHFKFHGGSGYAIAEKKIPLDLPENYRFTFYLRGETPVNNFELKLIDSAGNVYWIKQLNITYPKNWTKKAISKHNITFAWGPTGGGMIHKVDKIQFVVSAGTGGKGTIYIDEFKIQHMESDSVPPPMPIASASSFKKNHAPNFVLDNNGETSWENENREKQSWLLLDCQNVREIGGLIIDWSGKAFARHYQVELSDDKQEWTNGYEVFNSNGGRDYIYLPNAAARYVKLNFLSSSQENMYRVSSIAIQGFDFGSSLNAFYDSVAHDAPVGFYPKYFSHRQSYWTLIGASGDTREALMNEEGQIEVDKSSFSLEPFLFVNDSLITWNDVELKQSLEKRYLPIPSVEWRRSWIQLRVTGFASGEEGSSVLIARYKIKNVGAKQLKGKLFIAIRPFQVNPPWQFLNIVGGVSEISSVDYKDRIVRVNNEKEVVPLTSPDNFGAAEFDEGDITDYLSKGVVPKQQNVSDHFKHASAALEYQFDLSAGEEKEFNIAVPFHSIPAEYVPSLNSANSFVQRKLDETRNFWNAKVNSIDIELPGSAQEIINAVKSNLAYILINRDGPAIQPGSRSYERSWIRDGALTSTALLECGDTAEVCQFIDWYAKYIYPSGKVPCVVDTRGADPVPENDSHGEFIYAVMQYFRFTRDTTWLRGKFPDVVEVVRYIQSLRAQRMTDKYRNGTPEERACYGLVPESISHEGYSNHPEHSYWDDFFTLRGLKDAATIAAVVGNAKLEKEFASERDDFRKCLYASMKLAMQNKNINYIPGCVELGDFDATSTTIGIDPGGELGNIPEPQLHNTFQNYYSFFVQREKNKIDWTAYTPYETRIIGSFIRLGEREKVQELINFFMHDRRPATWNEWAEVVWKDRDTPKYIGDMPHTWVGSDFIRSVRSMFVYERERDTSLVIGAGISEEWISDTLACRNDSDATSDASLSLRCAGTNRVVLKNLPTYYGKLSYTVSSKANSIVYSFSGTVDMLQTHLVVTSPRNAIVQRAFVNGKVSKVQNDNTVEVRKFPATVELEY